MSPKTTRRMFVNLPVHDLEKSMQFFTTLGFGFNPRFTDARAACMIVSEQAYVMLITEPFFKTFIKRAVCDTARYTEGLFALSCEARAEVDDLARRAIAAGGEPAMEPLDQGFMYGRSFYDLDGHHWEVVWVDPHAP